MKMVARNFYEGGCACDEQAIPLVSLISSLPSANAWSVIQNNNNNEYYFNLADGSYNNNNKNNNNWVVPVELERLYDEVFRAEADCWKNKHSSWDAAKYHYHAGGRIVNFIYELYRQTYHPWKSYCFIVLYPRPREIFAAHYQDRIAHHLVAPYLLAVSEAVHRANGNVSFGNRKNVSSFHACMKVQELMKEHMNGYVVSWDIKGFFMSIDKEIAWRVFCEFEEEYPVTGYSDSEKQFYRWLIRLLIMHNPSKNCDRRSPEKLWVEYIPPEKTLFNNDNRGIPIGNYYSQIIANLLLAKICRALREYNIVEFVDDFVCVEDSVQRINEAEKLFDLVASEIGVKRHPKKKYIQPVRHGILWCGHKIYSNRMYISNRTVRNCERKIDEFTIAPNLRNARSLQQTINSYFGMMIKCAEWNTQKKIMERVLNSKYSKWLYFKKRKTSVVCQLRKRYKESSISVCDINSVDLFLKQYKQNN